MPHFLDNRTLYEVRERPARTYSWKVFILSNIIAELPWRTVLAVVQFFTWYYPLGMCRNAIAVDELQQRGGLMFLIIWCFLIFSSTFSRMLGTIMPDAATGINISATAWSFSLIFCGILVKPSALPRFWIFMYRASPITYFVQAIVSTGVSGVEIECAPNEIVIVAPPAGQSCESYLKQYIEYAGGRLLHPGASQQCKFCRVTDTSTLLASLDIHFVDRWMNFGITLVYIFANVAGSLLLYWLIRVPKRRKYRGM